MSYFAKISWKKKPNEAFTDRKYSRAHRWAFDGGVEMAGSSSPHVVPLPYSDATAVDPEEALVAAAASCHMLSFLAIAAAKKYVVATYEDNAEGIMGKNAEGREAILTIVLRPKIVFEGDKQPTLEEHEQLHHQAHRECYIANSIRSAVITELSTD